jgi:6,7-dimethyl-8-ribityllumazine synthase
MPTQYQGHDAAGGNRFAIVVSRYNESITKRLLDGAVQTLKAAGVADDTIDVAWVPGAFEIPLVADQMAASGRYAAVLCLGAVIKGDTSHDKHINRAVSMGIMEVNLRHQLPVLFGVLTCDTMEQAIQRAGDSVSKKESAGPAKTPVSNKGVECAEAALEMVSLLSKLRAGQ